MGRILLGMALVWAWRWLGRWAWERWRADVGGLPDDLRRRSR